MAASFVTGSFQLSCHLPLGGIVYKSVRRRWALGGLLAGIAYVLADLLFEWRGPRYLHWGSEGTISNVAQMATEIFVFFLIAFAIGYAIDHRVVQGR